MHPTCESKPKSYPPEGKHIILITNPQPPLHIVSDGDNDAANGHRIAYATSTVGTRVTRAPVQIRMCALTHLALALGRTVVHDGKSYICIRPVKYLLHGFYLTVLLKKR